MLYVENLLQWAAECERLCRGKLWSEMIVKVVWLDTMVVPRLLLHSFFKLDRSRSNRAKRSAFIIKSDLLRRIWEKSDLEMPICAAGRQCSLFSCKRGRGLRRCVQTRTRWPRPLRPERSARFFSPDWIDLVWQIWIDLDLKKNAAIHSSMSICFSWLSSYWLLYMYVLNSLLSFPITQVPSFVVVVFCDNLLSCVAYTPWAIKFHKVVRQQNSGAMEDFILPYSAVYLRIQKRTTYWNRPTFAKVIAKIKVAPFLWPTVYILIDWPMITGVNQSLAS